jgi:hypothetical protein
MFNPRVRRVITNNRAEHRKQPNLTGRQMKISILLCDHWAIKYHKHFGTTLTGPRSCFSFVDLKTFAVTGSITHMYEPQDKE